MRQAAVIPAKPEIAPRTQIGASRLDGRLRGPDERCRRHEEAYWLAGVRVAAAAGVLRPAAGIGLRAIVRPGQTSGAALGRPEQRWARPARRRLAGRAGADVYCGTWQQPSARVRAGRAGRPPQLADLATASHVARRHRRAFLLRAAGRHHDPRRPAGRADAMHPAGRRLAARRHGGAGQRTRSGTPTACCRRRTVMERSIGVLAGVMRADAAPRRLGAPTRCWPTAWPPRHSAPATSAQFDALMAAGTRANLADNSGRGRERPSAPRWRCSRRRWARTIRTPRRALMTLALQLSNEGRYAEATRCSPRPTGWRRDRRTRRRGARLLHYRGAGRAEPGAARAGAGAAGPGRGRLRRTGAGRRADSEPGRRGAGRHVLPAWPRSRAWPN